jgi:ketosteroid isomerase-like protein
MADDVRCEPARDPQELERLLVVRQWAGDVDGMAALYEPDAVLDCGSGRLVRGREAIRAFYTGLVAEGRRFDVGEQRPALISGDVALTSTQLPDGSVTAEVARRQGDGTWLWVIDQFAIAERVDSSRKGVGGGRPN